LQRKVGATTLIAGAAMEVIVALEHVDMVRQMLPEWIPKVFTHEIALPVILVGLILLLLRETKHGEGQVIPEVPGLAATVPNQQQTASGNAAVKDSGNAMLKDVGNPRIAIYTNQPLPSAPPKRLPEIKPNVSFKSVRLAWISYDEEESFFIEVSGSQHASVRGLIARFKNESGSHKSDDARYVRAELIFRDVNDQEMEQGVHSACWLREYTDTVDIMVGEDRWVFLGSLVPDDKNQWIVPWKQKKRTWEGPYYDLEGHSFSGMRSVEIRLIGEYNKWLINPVVVDIAVNDVEPTVSVRPPV